MPWTPPPKINTAWYTQITDQADAALVNFDSALSEAPRITRTPVRRLNIADSGKAEYLLVRRELTVQLIWEFLSKIEIDGVEWFVANYGEPGTQVKVILARTIGGVTTPAGQWEYDDYNTYFNKAELIDPSFTAVRRLRTRDIYSAVLTFRQGS